MTQPGSAAQRYPWRVRCSGCGWVDHFDAEATAQSWADQHNASNTSWPHDARVSPRETEAPSAALVPAVRGMTVGRLIDQLACMPPDTEVVVNASDGAVEVFALLKAAEHEPTCDDVMVCRLYADQEDDDAR